MKKYVLLLAFFYLFLFHLNGETMEKEITSSPHIFHNIGWNLLDSFTFNYGLNFIGAGAGTWGMIETGIDWKWRNTVFDNSWLTNIGSVVMPAGNIVPVITPLAFYIFGKSLEDEKLMITAAALTQSLILTVAVQSPLKMITGRREPDLADNAFHDRVYSEDDFSGTFNWFNMDFVRGWPSGHTANAFSAAATISEIYYDKTLIKLGAYTYAVLMGFGVTLYAHWTSEAFAGALIGYAVGKTVGKSYRQFLDKDEHKNRVSFFGTFNSAGVIIHL